MKKLVSVVLALCLCVLSVACLAESTELVMTKLCPNCPFSAMIPANWTTGTDDTGNTTYTNADSTMQMAATMMNTTVDDVKTQLESNNAVYTTQTINGRDILMGRTNDKTQVVIAVPVTDTTTFGALFTIPGGFTEDHIADIYTIVNSLTEEQ